MADKRIDQLTAATTMGDDDLLVLQQNNQAKKLSGATLSDYIYDVVEVSNTEPAESRNKVWIKPSSEDLVLAEMSDVDELKTATLDDYTPLQMTKNSYVKTNGSTVTMEDGSPKTQSTVNFNCCVTSCVEGDEFTVNGSGGSTARLWAFVDSTGNILSVSASGASATGLVLTAPHNAAFFIYHNSVNSNAVSYSGVSTLYEINQMKQVTSQISGVERINLGWGTGTINKTTGVEEYGNVAVVKSFVYIPVSAFYSLACTGSSTIGLRFYDANKGYLGASQALDITSLIKAELDAMLPTGTAYIRTIGYIGGDPITDILAFSNTVDLRCVVSVVEGLQKDAIYPESNKIFTGNVGNMSIVCAKEHTNDDGNFPVIEWYLLEEAGSTNRFYISRDLVEKQYAFTFIGNAYQYSFGVLANGDIIAVLDASSVDWDEEDERSESYRKNPYVFLAKENWAVQHEVSFSSSVKPMGWLSNYGFRVLPNGTALFAEYTRYCVLTANVWKVSGDPTVASNWTIIKQLELPAPNQALLKHWHTVQYDPYSGVIYAATGDSDSGSFCFYSTDNGSTWTALTVDGVDHSSKYFRFLNLIFTEDYIYWAKDWYDAEHYLFKCGRDANGVLDIANVVDYIAIPEVENLSTYTTCYMPEIDAILLLEREDSGGGTTAPAPIRLCDLANGTLHTIGYMESAKGIREEIGFRTRYSEVYPIKCVVNIGWALRRQINANAVNLLKWYDNAGNTFRDSYGRDNVNNLWLEVYKNSSGYKLKVGTRLI